MIYRLKPVSRFAVSMCYARFYVSKFEGLAPFLV